MPTAASCLSTRAFGATLVLITTLLAGPLLAQDFSRDKFRQLEEILPTANDYRAASGAPGHEYWQQEADYVIEVEIDDETQRLIGSERITYRNHSTDSLPYLWLQIDQNLFANDSDSRLSEKAPGLDDKTGYTTLRRLLYMEDKSGGATIHSVTDANGQPLDHTVVKTMLRLNLAEPLEAGDSIEFSIDWSYPILDAVSMRMRSGYEYFEDDGNYIYEIAQWFPRMAAYTDVNGWQHKQFLGSGEFTLEFGDYQVSITVPDDHIVASTGVLQNPDEVLTSTQRQRLADAETADKPVFVVTPDEAKANETSTPSGKKTWIFHADDVRDFAFATSRKFIWDAWGHRAANIPGPVSPLDAGHETVMAMSFYPNEAEPLWSTYSTHSVVHTLEVYSRYTFRYPYPVAISVNGPVGGMEYPMICFNGPRTEDDGTYFDVAQQTPGGGRKFWNRTKYGLISVVIHEVGHNYFPMIVNSDERQWTWMDEGLNTFLQFVAEAEWEENYPSRRGEPKNMIPYMVSQNQVPIMTQSDSILQFGNNAYGKPATALNVLRETVLGREQFDYAFRQYSQEWKFKRPTPYDFFRTMEEASGTDLDWFWRGWFYTTDHVDIALTGVHLYQLDSQDPDLEKPKRKAEQDAEPTTKRDEGFAPLPKRVDRYPELQDFYNRHDEHAVTEQERDKFTDMVDKLEPWEREILDQGRDVKFYVLDFENQGGLVTPIPLHITYADGSDERLTLPAEIWRRSPDEVSKLLIRRQEITSIEVDPQLETADVDVDDNHWPPKPVDSRFKLFKADKPKNPMQQAAEAKDGKSKKN